MPKKPDDPKRALIKSLAELAVDDAIRMAEKHPGKKRTRFNKRVNQELLAADAQAIEHKMQADSRERKGEKK